MPVRQVSTARPELVEGRAPNSSWFDQYILSEALMLRRAQHERRVEGYILSETLMLRRAQHERHTSVRTGGTFSGDSPS
jgi:hypothetical protein